MEQTKLKTRVKLYICAIIFISILSSIIDFWMENGSNDIYCGIKEVIDPHIINLIIVIICAALIIILIYKSLTAYYEEEIRLRDNLLERESRVIWQKYYELHRFQKKELLINALEKFVKHQDHVNAVQLYSYSIKYGRKVIIKVKYDCGYVLEGENLNVIQQSYYAIPKRLFIDFKKATNSGEFIEYFNFINKYQNKLLSKRIENLNEDDVYTYELLLLAIQEIVNEFNYEIVLDENLLLRNEIVEKLTNIKRAAIIKSILISEGFYFYRNYGTNRNGQNKVYLTARVDFYGVQMLGSVLISPMLIDADNDIEELNSIGNDLVSSLEQISSI